MRQSLYRVTVSGQGLQMWMDGFDVPVSAAFVKNEYVVADSESQAGQRALARVGTRLRNQLGNGVLVCGSKDIDVDRVARCSTWWKLLLPEGFVFLTAPPWPPSPSTDPRVSSRSAPDGAPSRGRGRTRRCRARPPR